MIDAPLHFEPTRAFVDDVQSVLFFARRGDRVLRCYVTRKARGTCFGGAGDEADEADEAGCLRTYDRHAPAIQGVARRMIERAAGAGTPAVVVTTSEVFRTIVDRQLVGAPASPSSGHGACHG